MAGETKVVAADVKEDVDVNDVKLVNSHPVVSALLSMVGTMVAILDENRKIISINNVFMNAIGVSRVQEILGLKLGQVLQCTKACGDQHSCGDMPYCDSCGASKTILSSLHEDQPLEQLCVLSVHKGNDVVDITLKVKSSPLQIKDKKFVVLLISDVTKEQKRAALERTFFHDINNVLGGLIVASELLVKENLDAELAEIIHGSAIRLKREVEMQKLLLKSDFNMSTLSHKEMAVGLVLDEVQMGFTTHPLCQSRHLIIDRAHADIQITTDLSLLLRVLNNMVINALEASAVGDTVNFRTRLKEDDIVFSVQNVQVIPEAIRERIFQRNFSTKSAIGRGVGTYSMKLFGEKILGGKVRFTSDESQGTIFEFALAQKRSAVSIENGAPMEMLKG